MNNETAEVLVFFDDCACLPENAKEFMKFFNDKLSEVPDEYIDSAKISVECFEYYGQANLEVNVTYERPLTNEEREKQEADRELKKLLETTRKKAQLENLKRELGES